ncbi:30S ribosomal protein S16 [Candidatus Jorgensenbacteria bacterium CG23_combo_of_CG06-09_8_20_14_all_54_14]|uniref:Small ribosomal subunit protein bS16 n=1 Tax=Candidatus Jorgensenbacteria bacterium CG23_combo_of_CG06-09_8_20_14_all_54_14 TaxID=1974595 RepID=A0A2G9Z9R7_9BACT|nr:MAG: 30S ribosomal protein S16 [Candidatus Jorgensenbacteria bacterium CG23_combo_of_CG06-09_8_20_14_all_54_14]
MLSIKLKRVGKKHQASFRIVVAEKRSKLQGRSVEDLGWMNPRTKEEKVNKDRVKYWLGVGAQPTPTVWNILVRAGAVEGKKIPVHKKAKTKKGEAPPAAVSPAPTVA